MEKINLHDYTIDEVYELVRSGKVELQDFADWFFEKEDDAYERGYFSGGISDEPYDP